MSKISFFVFFVLCASLFPQSDHKILFSGPNEITIAYYPVYTDTGVFSAGSRIYRNTGLLNGVPVSYTPGEPMTSKRTFVLGVPSVNGTGIEVLSVSGFSIQGKPAPVPEARLGDDGEAVYVYNEGERYLPSAGFENIPVSAGNTGITRGLLTQEIDVHPFFYDAAAGKIDLIREVIFRVRFGPAAGAFTQVSSDELLEASVLNFGVAKNWIQKKNNLTLNKPVAAVNSVLGSGKWIRFEVTQEGIYKITKSQLRSFGLDPDAINPKTIKIYSGSGEPLSEKVNASAPADLTELAIHVQGEADDRFDDADYILVYCTGTAFVKFDTTAKYVKRIQHPYSVKNYYWITGGGAPGKRMAAKNGSQASAGAIIQTTSEAVVFNDDDKINIGHSGRYFFGDEFSEVVKSRTYTNRLEGIVAGTPINYKYAFANTSVDRLNLSFRENNNQFFSKNIAGTSFDPYLFGALDSGNVNYTPSAALTDDRSLLTITFGANNSTAYGYLDFLEIRYTRSLRVSNDEVAFYTNPLTGGAANVEYQLSNFSNSDIYVFDVSDYSNVKMITSPVMQSGGEYRFNAAETASGRSKYYALTSGRMKQPGGAVEIANQNLTGDITGANLIIITNKIFRDPVQRLKVHRETNPRYALTTKVFYQDEIFNQFSAGVQDVAAIRNFIKYAYDNWTVKPSYVLMFGDGDYDYKNIEGKSQNYLLTYQSVNTLDEADSTFSTDDFYVWVDGEDRKIDLAIGRITASTLTEANNIVDKIIAYDKSADKGLWRNLITLVADDHLTSQGRDGAPNTQQSEQLSNNSNCIPTSYDQKKIYLVTYPTTQTNLGRRKPEVNEAIVEAFNSGTLIINYIGHGSPELWAHEQVFVKSSTIPRLVNSRLPFLTAATCDFGYYDKVDYESATDEMLLKRDGGIIGGFTSVRLVYSFQNAQLSQEFYKNLLNAPRGVNNLPVSLGGAMFATKQVYNQVNDIKYHIFGDPSLRLLVPQYESGLTSVNNSNPEVTVVPVKALSSVNIKGNIKKVDGSVWSDFNGEAIISVYDSQTKMYLPDIGPADSMSIQGGLIFRGRVSVTNGQFNSDFVVPKDISYENKRGKVVVYFFSETSDGIGSTNNIIVGGTDATAVNDGKGPEVSIYFDNEEYDNSLLVNPNSVLIVKLNDQTGLNTTGTGIGHKLEGIITGSTSSTIDLSGFFTGDLDSGGKSGRINYRFNNLESGEYELKVKAWDVFNNLSVSQANFKVVNSAEPVVDYVMNYPNPFHAGTWFTFQHNIDELIDVKIIVYSVAGRKITDIEKNWINDRFVRIEWDGRDKDGDLLANGTYLYKVIVKSSSGSINREVLGKLAIIR